MINCLLLAAALALAVAGDDPRELVGRLGAERFDDRVAAVKALERLGAVALPALREAADSPDPRVRSRARDLVESLSRRAESERFSRPTAVRLDAHDRPLGEVVDALNTRDDLGLVLRPGPLPRRREMFAPRGPDLLARLKDRRVTLEAAEPVPFWEAVDRLCAAASLRYDVAPQARFGATQGSLVLMGDRTGRGPVSDSGPFRVQVTRLHAAFQRDLTGEPGRAPGVLIVALAVLAEPGLAVHPAGPVKVEEAVDDQGHSLAPLAPDAAGRPPVSRPGTNQVAGFGSFRVDLALAAPDTLGASLRRLRGVVPVVAVARHIDPLVIPLAGDGPRVRTFQTRDGTFAVDRGEPRDGAGSAVTITFRPSRGARARSRPLSFGSRGVGYDRGQEHLELYDATGRRLEHSLGSQSRGADNLGFYDRYTLTLGPPAGRRPAGAPGGPKAPVATELRYYEFAQTEVVVPFDYRDLDLP